MLIFDLQTGRSRGKLRANDFYVITAPMMALWEGQHEVCNI